MQTQGLKFRGRPPIRIAESVHGVVHLKNPYAQAIMDRSTSLTDDLVESVLDQSPNPQLMHTTKHLIIEPDE